VEEDRGEVGYLKFFSRAKIGVSVAKGRMYVARRPKISAFWSADSSNDGTRGDDISSRKILREREGCEDGLKDRNRGKIKIWRGKPISDRSRDIEIIHRLNEFDFLETWQ